MYCCPSDCDCSLLVCSCKVVTVGLFSWTNYLRRSECPAFVGSASEAGHWARFSPCMRAFIFFIVNLKCVDYKSV